MFTLKLKRYVGDFETKDSRTEIIEAETVAVNEHKDHFLIMVDPPVGKICGYVVAKEEFREKAGKMLGTAWDESWDHQFYDECYIENRFGKTTQTIYAKYIPGGGPK
jgi:hypothetical protein